MSNTHDYEVFQVMAKDSRTLNFDGLVTVVAVSVEEESVARSVSYAMDVKAKAERLATVGGVSDAETVSVTDFIKWFNLARVEIPVATTGDTLNRAWNMLPDLATAWVRDYMDGLLPTGATSAAALSDREGK